MADPIQTGFLSLTDRLSRFIPLLGAFDRAVAWLAHFLGCGDSTLIGPLAGFTFLCGIPVFLRLFFGSRGMRSVQQLGLPASPARGGICPVVQGLPARSIGNFVGRYRDCRFDRGQPFQ